MASNASFSQEIKKRVIFHCKNGENIRLVAKYNDVPLSVARSWMSELAEADDIGRGRPQKLSDGMKDFVRRRVEEDPGVSASALADEMAAEFDARISASLIKKSVRELCKRSEQAAAGGSAKKMRNDFLEDHDLAVAEGSRIVYTDECHFYLQPDADSEPEQHFLLVAMTTEAIVHHSVVRRNMSSRVYLLGWLKELAKKIEAQKTTGLESTVVVLDNAPYHGGVEGYLKRYGFKDISVLRLAPTFSRDNPAEKVFFEVQKAVRKARRSCQVNGLDCRKTYAKILDSIEEAVSSVTASDCRRFVNQTLNTHKY